MKKYVMNKSDIIVSMLLIDVGNDLCVVIFGGDDPHIGCVTLGIPRPSLDNNDTISSTSSIINKLGHKDDKIALYVSEKLVPALNKDIAISCGIHIDNITNNEIDIIFNIIEKLTERIINDYKGE